MTQPTAAPAPIGLDPSALVQAYATELADTMTRALIAEQQVQTLQQQLHQLQQQAATQSDGDESPTMDATPPPAE